MRSKPKRPVRLGQSALSSSDSEVMSNRKQSTHACWGSDSRCWPPHYLRRETRTREMPSSPVVRSCRRHGDRRSPSTHDELELFGAEVVLNLPSDRGSSRASAAHRGLWGGTGGLTEQKRRPLAGVHRCARHEAASPRKENPAKHCALRRRAATPRAEDK